MKAAIRLAIATIAATFACQAGAFDLSDNPVNRAMGKLNDILTGVNKKLEQGLQTFDRGALLVKVDAAGGDFIRLEASNGTRQVFRVAPGEVDYVYRAGLADAATKACGGRDYRYTESSSSDNHAWQRWVTMHTMTDEEVAADPRLRSLILTVGPGYSLVWNVECGRSGGWKFPGERAMTMPVDRLLAFMKPKFASMPALTGNLSPVKVFLPTGHLVQQVHGVDVRTKEGHMHMFRLRLLNTGVAARLQQAGVNAEVVEYDDPSSVGAEDGLYVLADRNAVVIVTKGSRREWNPATDWSEVMRRPVASYGDTIFAFGDAGATFATVAR